jgi:hypothetical protein
MPRLTVDAARHMGAVDLAEHVYGMLEEFEALGDDAIAQEREAWINRTLERCPDVHSWILTLHAYFDHWTEWAAQVHGTKDPLYKSYRVRRDICDNGARAARLRYEGASRRVTQLQRHEESSGMKGSR